MLRVENVSASYRKIKVLEGIEFQVEEGEFLGIIGPNGAGKTTLLKIMTGVKQPSSGKVMLNNRNINDFSRKEIAKIMAVVPQNAFIPSLFMVEDVVLMGRYSHQRNRFYTTKEDIAICEEVMRKTDTIAFRHRQMNELSGGERQRVIIARSLAQQPKILLLDEPTANLDIKHQMKILTLIKTLVQQDGITAIMVIHDLNLAARFCDRLILLSNQKIYTQGRPEEVLMAQNLAKTYEVKTKLQYNPTINSLQVVVIDSM